MKRIGYMPPRTYHFRPQSRTPQSRTYHFRIQSRTPPPCAYHFCVHVGAYCIRPTDIFGRKRTPCICVIHFWMYAGFMRFRVIRVRLRETFMWFCTYSPRSGASVGRMLLRPTRGHKMVVRNGGIRDRVHEMVMSFCLSLFFGR